MSVSDVCLRMSCQDFTEHAAQALEFALHSTASTTSASERALLSHTAPSKLQTATMSEAQVTLRTRKFIRNPLLGRKQMVVCVTTLRIHKHHPCRHTFQYYEQAQSQNMHTDNDPVPVTSSTPTVPTSAKTSSAANSANSTKPPKTKSPASASGHSMGVARAPASR